MTANWKAGTAVAAVFAAALTGCDKVAPPSTPPPPKTAAPETARSISPPAVVVEQRDTKASAAIGAAGDKLEAAAGKAKTAVDGKN